jgi:hypothetical protein
MFRKGTHSKRHRHRVARRATMSSSMAKHERVHNSKQIKATNPMEIRGLKEMFKVLP